MSKRFLKIIDGQRDQLEAELVRELFVSGYNAEKADRLIRRGKLKLISSRTEDSLPQSEQTIPYQST